MRGVVRRRPLLRTAVVGGGAYLAGKSAAQRSAARTEQEQGQAQGAAPPVPSPREEPGAGGSAAGSSVSGQLDELARMHASGALTDAEFSAAKARVLG